MPGMGKAAVAALVLALVASGAMGKETKTRAPEKTLYVVGTAHLDTQWLWTIRETINECVPNTLRENLALFGKYPDYVFSFEGAFRYALAKEYYPEEYAKLKDVAAHGRWRVAGSMWDAVDANLPSPESLARQVLHGNGFFRREFGTTSCDVYLPDCFGFGFALQKAGLTYYRNIVNVFRFTDLTVLKFMLTAIAVGMVGVFALQSAGLATLPAVPTTYVVGNLVGGLIFGVGMAGAGF